MIVTYFGQNADGLCGIEFKNGLGGHAFNWSTKDGNVTFFDGQDKKSKINTDKIDEFWNNIDNNGSLIIARLDNSEINYETIKKYTKWGWRLNGKDFREHKWWGWSIRYR